MDFTKYVETASPVGGGYAPPKPLNIQDLLGSVGTGLSEAAKTKAQLMAEVQSAAAAEAAAQHKALMEIAAKQAEQKAEYKQAMDVAAANNAAALERTKIEAKLGKYDKTPPAPQPTPDYIGKKLTGEASIAKFRVNYPKMPSSVLARVQEVAEPLAEGSIDPQAAKQALAYELMNTAFPPVTDADGNVVEGVDRVPNDKFAPKDKSGNPTGPASRAAAMAWFNQQVIATNAFVDDVINQRDYAIRWTTVNQRQPSATIAPTQQSAKPQAQKSITIAEWAQLVKAVGAKEAVRRIQEKGVIVLPK